MKIRKIWLLSTVIFIVSWWSKRCQKRSLKPLIISREVWRRLIRLLIQKNNWNALSKSFSLLFGKIIRECGSDIDLGKPTKQLACPSHKCSLRRSRGKWTYWLLKTILWLHIYIKNILKINSPTDYFTVATIAEGLLLTKENNQHLFY